MRKILIALAAVTVLAVAAVAPAGAESQAKRENIVATAVGAGQFTTLAALLQQAGLAKTLQGKGPYTVFAPTDKAFKAVPKATLAKLGQDKALLKKVLLYHVVKGKAPAAAVVKLNGKSVTTVAGAPVKIRIAGGKVFLNGSTRVVTPDVMASNGIIHVVNKVLLPPS